MQSTCLACQSSFAMNRISTVLRSGSGRAVVGGWLKCLPASSADYTSSAVLLRERLDTSRFTPRQKNSTLVTPPRPDYARPLDVSAGGGPRPRKPLQWRTKNKKGSVVRSEKMVTVIKSLSNVKEDVFGAMDAFIAWDLEFPLIAVKKALKILRDENEWRRIIQMSKWMLDKGQGKTLATYMLLLEAFDHEGRIDEAEVLWDRVLQDNMECIPKAMFALVIKMYDRYGKSKQLLKAFADMEELQVKPDVTTIEIAARTYTQYGYEEYGQSLFKKYPATNPEMRRQRPYAGKYKYLSGVDNRRQSNRDERQGEDTGELRETPTNVKNEETRVDLKERPRDDLAQQFEKDEKNRVESEEIPTSELSRQSEKEEEERYELKERPRLLANNTKEMVS